MSGGVGPTCNDINLSKEEEYEQKQSYDAISTKYPTSSPKAGYLSFQQLNAVAVILIFSASGMVSPEDFAFVFFSLLYMYVLSKVAFPIPTLPYSSKEPEPPGPVFSTRESKLLRLYVFVAAIIGLFLPIAYIFHGIFEGDKEGIKAATPHVFLLSSQVFMEGVASSDRFSLPIRVFVPVCYNARRIFTIVDWLRSEVSKVDEEYGWSKTRLYVGRSLAIANLAYWCFNLFGFLLPVFLPRAFKRYFSGHKVKD